MPSTHLAIPVASVIGVDEQAVRVGVADDEQLGQGAREGRDDAGHPLPPRVDLGRVETELAAPLRPGEVEDEQPPGPVSRARPRGDPGWAVPGGPIGDCRRMDLSILAREA